MYFMKYEDCVKMVIITEGKILGSILVGNQLEAQFIL